MIFRDKSAEVNHILKSEFSRLFELALKQQAHVGDLLLLRENGFYSEDALLFVNNDGTKFSPYVVGPGNEGHSEQTHYTFIDKYRQTNIHKLSFKEYLREIEYLQDNGLSIDELVEEEGTTIQIEMLIYLKFWEADMIIKRFYQFVRILNGEPYDWHFKISDSINEKRHEIIRNKIRDKLIDISPILYDLIKQTYRTQIRNSIAHSNYSFVGRIILLNNYKDDGYSDLVSIEFDDWVDLFHNTLMLHNQYIWLDNAINDFYRVFAMKCGNHVPIVITDKDGKIIEAFLRFNPNGNSWVYEK